MLLVPTVLRNSTIHGIGVFAVEKIPEGAEVWRFTPGFDLDLDPAIVEGFPRHMRDWFAHFGYVDYHLERLIVCLDNARFINHSDAPSLRSDYSRDPYGPDFAVRDIESGEELTADYSDFERESGSKRSLKVPILRRSRRKPLRPTVSRWARSGARPPRPARRG